MIQLRYAPRESDITKIFKQTEIFESFENKYKENESLLREQIKKYKEYLLSLSEEKEPVKTFTFNDGDIISEFRKSVKRQIVYWAINEIFSSGSLDVKNNILQLIDGEFLKNSILGKRLIYVFGEILYDTSKSEEYEEILIKKFIH